MTDRRGWRRFQGVWIIQSPPSEVYRLLERVDLYARWIPHLTRSYVLSGESLHPGSRCVFHATIAGIQLRIEGLVTDVVPERVLAFRSVGGPALNGRWALSPEGAGTRVEFTMGYRIPGGPIGLAARFVDVDNIIAGSARRAVERFRLLAEHPGNC